jgi:hypothetical protein
MKKLTVVLMGTIFLLGMVWVPGSFAQVPGMDLSSAVTPALSQCIGKNAKMEDRWESTGKCKDPVELADTSAITPALSVCRGKNAKMEDRWESSGKCKDPVEVMDTSSITPALSQCPGRNEKLETKWDAAAGKCKD